MTGNRHSNRLTIKLPFDTRQLSTTFSKKLLVLLQIVQPWKRLQPHHESKKHRH